MSKLEEICNELKLQFVTQFQQSNTGRLYIYDSDLNTKLASCFDFQDNCCKFNWYDSSADIIICGMVATSQVGCIKNTFLHYHKSDQMKKLFQWFREQLED